MSITQKVEFDRIELGKNPRQDFGDIKSLMGSLKRDGQLQPLIVRQVKGSKPVKYTLDAGGRRYEAIKRLREVDKKAFGEVDVVIREGNDDDARFAAWAENYQRKDLNPVEQASALQEMVNENYPIKDVAERIGISAQWAGKLIKVLTCTTAVLKALAKGDLTLSAAFDFVGLTESEQARLLAKCLKTKSEANAKGQKGDKAVKHESEEGAGKKRAPGKRKLGKLLNAIEENKLIESDYWRGASAALSYALGEDDCLIDEMEAEAKKRGITGDEDPPEDETASEEAGGEDAEEPEDA